MSGFGSRRSVRFLEVSKPGDRDATRGTDGEVYRRAGALSGGEIELRGGGRAAGVSERHFRRLRDRYEADGAEGLIDRRRGRVSGRRAPVDQIEFVIEQYRTTYWDFTVKHFHEALQAEHGFRLGYTWTKAVLQSRGLVRAEAHPVVP